MSDPKIKADFTAWYLAEMIELLGRGIERQARLNLEWLREDGSFADPSLRLALMAWQASRAALVIELPIKGNPRPEDEVSWHNIRNQTIEACARSVEAAGLRVKS